MSVPRIDEPISDYGPIGSALDQEINHLRKLRVKLQTITEADEEIISHSLKRQLNELRQETLDAINKHGKQSEIYQNAKSRYGITLVSALSNIESYKSLHKIKRAMWSIGSIAAVIIVILLVAVIVLAVKKEKFAGGNWRCYPPPVIPPLWRSL